MTDNTMVLGEDGSVGADLAWRWIMAHRWPRWKLEVVTLSKRSTRGWSCAATRH